MLLIGVVVYWVVKFLQGTRGARLLRGVLVLLVSLYLVVRLLSSVFGLTIIAFLYDKLLVALAAAVIIVFQPELRRALMRVGESRFFRAMSAELDRDIDELVEAAVFCSKRKIGALIAIEREVGLGGLTENATRRQRRSVGAAAQHDLLAQQPAARPGRRHQQWPDRLRRRAVPAGRERRARARARQPSPRGRRDEPGDRRRRAVVSEESGDISIAERGTLLRKLTPEAVRDMLGELLGRGELGPAEVGTSALDKIDADKPEPADDEDDDDETKSDAKAVARV